MDLENFSQKLGENLAYYEEEYMNAMNETVWSFVWDNECDDEYDNDPYEYYEDYEEYDNTMNFIKMRHAYQKEEQYA